MTLGNGHHNIPAVVVVAVAAAATATVAETQGCCLPIVKVDTHSMIINSSYTAIMTI